MTRNDHRQARSDKPERALIRIITLEAGHGAGRTGENDEPEMSHEYGRYGASQALRLALGLWHLHGVLRTRDCEAVMNSRNAKIWVYEEAGHDVVPPFLVGEVAGSLSINADREELKLFAETILGWLDRTASNDSANVYRLDPADGTCG